MKFKKLGNTDLDVSLICLGTMTWGTQNTPQDAYQQIDMALDYGVNFIDSTVGKTDFFNADLTQTILVDWRPA